MIPASWIIEGLTHDLLPTIHSISLPTKKETSHFDASQSLVKEILEYLLRSGLIDHSVVKGYELAEILGLELDCIDPKYSEE